MLQDDKFCKLKNEIDHEQIRYSIKSIGSVLLCILAGKFMGAYIFGDAGSIALFLAELPSNIILLLLIGAFLSVVTWHFKVLTYKKESQLRKCK